MPKKLLKKTLIKSVRIGGQKFAKRFHDTREGHREAKAWQGEMEQKREQFLHGNAFIMRKKKVKVLEAAASFLNEKRNGVRKARQPTSHMYFHLLRDHIFPTRSSAILTMLTTEDWLHTIESSKLRMKAEVKLQRIVNSDTATEAEVADAKTKLMEEYRKRTVPASNATKNRIRATLNALYEHAIKVDRIAFFNPIKPIPKYPETENTDYLTIEECRKYLKAARQVQRVYYVYTGIVMNWGNRTGEVLGIQWKDVDWQSRQIKIHQQWSRHANALIPFLKEDRLGRPKKVKFIIMNDFVFETLRIWFKETEHSGPEDYVISHPAGGKPIRPERLYEMHVETIQIAELRYVTLHVMRHSFASHFRMAGGNMADLQMILGHSDVKQTQRYSHLGPEYVKTLGSVVQISDEKGHGKQSKRRGNQRGGK